MLHHHPVIKHFLEIYLKHAKKKLNFMHKRLKFSNIKSFLIFD